VAGRRAPGGEQLEMERFVHRKDIAAKTLRNLLEKGQLVTVCGAGNSSAVAADQLRDRGFEAYSLEGGMKAWSMSWNTAGVSVPAYRTGGRGQPLRGGLEAELTEG
jgi:hypothetical protein